MPRRIHPASPNAGALYEPFSLSASRRGELAGLGLPERCIEQIAAAATLYSNMQTWEDASPTPREIAAAEANGIEADRERIYPERGKPISMAPWQLAENVASALTDAGFVLEERRQGTFALTLGIVLEAVDRDRGTGRRAHHLARDFLRQAKGS